MSSPTVFRTPRLRLLPTVILFAAACGDAGAAGDGEWAGTVDTLASGQVVVSNPDAPLWEPEEAWTLTEELRIGTATGEGPELFGMVRSIAVDDAGRIYVLDGQAQDVRVFGPDGAYIRTIGRKGNGPGELAGPLGAEIGPEGNLWIADPRNNRVSVFDTAGEYVEGHRMGGGFMMVPWPGGFDRHGHYYYPVPQFTDEGFQVALVKYDSALDPLDTLSVPQDPVERDFFEMRSGQSVAVASIPFGEAFRWWLSPEGSFWGLFTGDYRLFELSQDGDTLRTVTRAFEPLPVTDADMDQAREDLEWFTEQGGQVDWSKIPSTKPAAEELTFDDRGNLWVWPVTAPEQEGRLLDVFEDDGRYLGRITSPVPIATRPYPVFHDGAMYAVTESELEVPYVVRLRIGGSEP